MFYKARDRDPCPLKGRSPPLSDGCLCGHWSAGGGSAGKGVLASVRLRSAAQLQRAEGGKSQPSDQTAKVQKWRHNPQGVVLGLWSSDRHQA